MVINGPTDSTILIWSQTVDVTPNTYYDFSIYVASWSSTSPGQLNFVINDSSIGTFTASTTTGVWENFTVTWYSGSNTTATIQIFDLNTAPIGNDFALDDISFSPVPIFSSLLLFGSGLLGLIGLKWKA